MIPSKWTLKGLAILMALAAGLLFSPPPAAAQDEDVFDLSIEELMSVEVISATRTKGQSYFKAPAALHIIGQKDLRDSGHLHIAEALRLAPGMHVARIDASKWAISARGFNDRYNRMQLVQMDGRTLYNPVYAGVYWNLQDYILEDIEQIEVIRGPGATLWGANAVNGIINITTKDASQTQGFLVKAANGTSQRRYGAIRYGGKTGSDGYYRVYAKFKNQEEFETRVFDGTTYDDEWRLGMWGARADWKSGSADKFSLHGDGDRGQDGDSMSHARLTTGQMDIGQPLPLMTVVDYKSASDRRPLDGWNLTGSWTHTFSERSETKLQLYYDRNDMEYPNPLIGYGEARKIFDADFQHSISELRSHSLVWGLGYRRTDVAFNKTNTSKISFAPQNTLKDTLSGFVQDTMPLDGKDFKLTLGAKIERNDFTGQEIQPSARLSWDSNESNFVWGSVSRAVRVPALAHTNMQLLLTPYPVPQIPGSPVTFLNLNPNPDLKEEEVIAYEVGYRTLPSPSLTVDVAAFMNRHHRMLSIESPALGPGPDPTMLALQTKFNNAMSGKSHGIELSAKWDPTPRWSLTGNYSWLDVELSGGPTGWRERDTPKNQASILSSLHFDRGMEVNVAVYYYDNIELRGGADAVPNFIRTDLGLRVHSADGEREYNLWGENIFDANHREYSPDRYTSEGYAEVARCVYGEVVYRH